MTSKPLGLARLDDANVRANPYTHPTQDVIGAVDQAPGGNTILRVGKALYSQPGWERTGHIVLTPLEREQLIADLVAQRDPKE